MLQLASQSPLVYLQYRRGKLTENSTRTAHQRFDRLSTNFYNQNDSKQININENLLRKSQQNLEILSRPILNSAGADSGYSEESFPSRSTHRPSHTSCPHCHCEQRSSFNNYQKSRARPSTSADRIVHPLVKLSSDSESNSSDERNHFLSSRSYPHIKPLPNKIDFQTENRSSRQTNDQRQRRRRRNLSCDGSLWTRVESQKSIKQVTTMIDISWLIFFSSMN